MSHYKAVAAFLLITGPAMADQTQNAATTLRNRFEVCVYQAASDAYAKGAEVNSAVEQGFAACQTEFEAIQALLTVTRMPLAESVVVMSRLKTNVKNGFVQAFSPPRR